MKYEEEFLTICLKLCENSGNFFTIKEFWQDITNVCAISKLQFVKLIKKLIRDKIIIYNNGNIRVKSSLYIVSRLYELNPMNFKYFSYLKWQNFEIFCKNILENHEFQCITNYRFKIDKNRTRREIDIIAYRPNLLLSIDCKKWSNRYKTSAIEKAISEQIERTKFLIKFNILKNKFPISLENKKTEIIPIIVISVLENTKSFKIPVVPIYQFNSFIDQIYLLKYSNYLIFTL